MSSILDRKTVSRRGILRLGAGLTASALLAACAPQVVKETVVVQGTPEVVEKEVTKVVEKEVEVTRVVEKVSTQAAAKNATLITVHHRTGVECDNWSYFAQKFNEEHYPDLFVKMLCIPGSEYFQKLGVEAAGGTLADVIWISSIEGFYRMSATGTFAQLDDLIASSGLDLTQFYPENIEASKLQGKMYGIPELAHPGRVGLFYYKPVFDAAGVGYPADTWTYDDLLTAAQQLTNPDEGTFGFMDPERSYFSVLPYCRAWGGDVINEDGTKCPLDTAEAVAALQYYSDLYNKYKVSPMPGQTTQGAEQTMAAGKLAMYQSGFWGDNIKNYVNKGTWGSAAMPIGPTGKRGSMFECDPACLNAQSKVMAEAFSFITTLVTHDAQMHRWQVRGGPSVRPDVMNSEEVQTDPVMKVFGGIMQSAGPLVLPANFRETEYFKYIGESLDAVWLGQATLEEILDQTIKGAQAILDKPALGQ